MPTTGGLGLDRRRLGGVEPTQRIGITPFRRQTRSWIDGPPKVEECPKRIDDVEQEVIDEWRREHNLARDGQAQAAIIQRGDDSAAL